MSGLIRRAELFNKLAPVQTLAEAYAVIQGMPEVDAVEVVHGRWIEISSSNHTYKCSECGRLLVNITDGNNNVAKHYPYCHCGAKMDGKDGDGNG